MTERDCAAPATWRVFWPGRPPLLMCADHATAARNVANAIGLHLHMELYAGDAACTNKVTD